MTISTVLHCSRRFFVRVPFCTLNHTHPLAMAGGQRSGVCSRRSLRRPARSLSAGVPSIRFRGTLIKGYVLEVRPSPFPPSKLFHQTPVSSEFFITSQGKPLQGVQYVLSLIYTRLYQPDSNYPQPVDNLWITIVGTYNHITISVPMSTRTNFSLIHLLTPTDNPPTMSLLDNALNQDDNEHD